MLIIAIWLLFGVGASYVASNRGANGALWFFLGMLFGPLGLAMAFASGSSRRCPFCCERIHPNATKCPKCQSALPAGAEHPIVTTVTNTLGEAIRYNPLPAGAMATGSASARLVLALVILFAIGCAVFNVLGFVH